MSPWLSSRQAACHPGLAVGKRRHLISAKKRKRKVIPVKKQQLTCHPGDGTGDPRSEAYTAAPNSKQGARLHDCSSSCWCLCTNLLL